MAATVVSITPKRVSFGNGGSLVETWIIDTDARTMPSAAERQFYQETILKKSTTTSTMSSSGSTHSQGSLPPHNGGIAGHDRPSEDTPPTHPASRGGKQNGSTTTHHVTFAESPTEHGIPSTDLSDEDRHSVITNKLGRPHNGHAHRPDGILHTHAPPAGLTASPTSHQGAPLPPIIKLHRSASTESHENPFLADGELSKKADYIISHSTISRTELKIEDPDSSKGKPAAPAPIEEPITANAAPTVQAAPDNARPNDIGVKGQNGKLEEPVAPSSVEVVEKGKAANPEPEQAEEVKVKDSKKCKCCTIM